MMSPPWCQVVLIESGATVARGVTVSTPRVSEESFGRISDEGRSANNEFAHLGEHT